MKLKIDNQLNVPFIENTKHTDKNVVESNKNIIEAKKVSVLQKNKFNRKNNKFLTNSVADPQSLAKYISNDPDKCEITINKYPGTLHISMDSISKLEMDQNNMLLLQVFINGKKMITQKYHENSFIKIGKYLKIPISEKFSSPIKLGISLQTVYKTHSRDAREAIFIFTKDRIDELHNKLVGNKCDFTRSSSNYIITMISKLFHTHKTEDTVKIHCSYISDDEVKLLDHKPESLSTLCKWIMNRKYAYSCLFEGEINIKGVNMIYNWKRVYIKWYGYRLYIFDCNNKEYISEVSLIDSIPFLGNVKKSLIKFIVQDNEIQLHFDTSETLFRCLDAIYTIFVTDVTDWI